MTQSEAIKALLKGNRKTQTWLAEKLGYKGPSSVATMIYRGNITVDTLAKICEVMDYEITIQPKHRPGQRPQGQIVIEGGKE